MKNNNLKYIVVLLFIVGAFLIIFSSLLLVPDNRRDAVFYLDLSVACLIYLVIASKFYIRFGDNNDFDSQIGGIGVYWKVIITYISLAIFGIIIGFNLSVSFKVQLVYQSFFFFAYLVGLFLTSFSIRHAVSVNEKEQNFKSEIFLLRETITDIEIAFAGKSSTLAEAEILILKIKDKIRYLSASDNSKAKQLEVNILEEANSALNSLKSANPDQQLIIAKLTTCETLLDKRKQFLIK